MFNALAGMELSEVAARRPTTGKPMACVWGGGGADALLDWLDVPRRHRTARESVLDADREAELAGLVLLDLPDHDSTQLAHRLEVDRLVELVDLLVWVVDPQKYADDALHAGYLQRLTGHDAVMLVVLNQIDRLDEDEVDVCTRDLRRLLDADGLTSVRLLTASAVRGDGVDTLRTVLADVVRGQGVVVDRAMADLDDVSGELRSALGPAEADVASLATSGDLVDALSAASGVPAILDAVGEDYQRRAAGSVGWPLTRWVRRLRPDPLARLHLGAAEADVRRLIRSSLPSATPSQRARVDLAVRTLTATAADDLPTRWGEAVRTAVTPPGDDLSDALDEAVTSVELTSQRPAWWSLVGGLQILLALMFVGGIGWLAALGVGAAVGLPAVDTPFLGPLPVPTAMLLVGLLGGLLLTFLARAVVRWGAQRRQAQVAGQLREAVHGVAEEHILRPVVQVLQDHRTARQALDGQA
jgi:hypothetical protein